MLVHDVFVLARSQVQLLLPEHTASLAAALVWELVDGAQLTPVEALDLYLRGAAPERGPLAALAPLWAAGHPPAPLGEWIFRVAATPRDWLAVVEDEVVAMGAAARTTRRWMGFPTGARLVIAPGAVAAVRDRLRAAARVPASSERELVLPALVEAAGLAPIVWPEGLPPELRGGIARVPIGPEIAAVSARIVG